MSVFGGLFIHLAANFSLLRVSIHRARKKLFGGMSSLKTVFYPFGEIALAISAVIITALDLVLSMLSTALFYVTLFLGWIVVGYLLSDIKEIVFKAPANRARGNNSQNSLWQRVGSLTAIDIRKELPDVVVKLDDQLKVVVKKCADLDSSAAIVIDENNRPRGTILLRDIVGLSEEELNGSSVGLYALTQVATVTRDESALNLAETFRQTGLPILAIVDDGGKFVGTVREREIIRRLAFIQENYFLGEAGSNK